MARPRVEVVHVGSACRDVVPEDPRGWRLGGGVTYASLTTARLGLRTAAIVGVDATAATAQRARHAPRGRRRPAARAARRGPDLPQPRDAEGPGADVREDRGAAAGPGHARVVARGAGLVAGAGRRRADRRLGRRVPAGAHLAVAWQGFLRELAAGEQVRRRPPRPVADPAPGRPRRGQPPRRAGRDAPVRAVRLSWVRAPTCSSPRAPTAGC